MEDNDVVGLYHQFTTGMVLLTISHSMVVLCIYRDGNGLFCIRKFQFSLSVSIQSDF